MVNLTNRQKTLLKNFGKFVEKGKLDKSKLVKIMFLLKQEGAHARKI